MFIACTHCTTTSSHASPYNTNNTITPLHHNTTTQCLFHQHHLISNPQIPTSDSNIRSQILRSNPKISYPISTSHIQCQHHQQHLTTCCSLSLYCISIVVCSLSPYCISIAHTTTKCSLHVYIHND